MMYKIGLYPDGIKTLPPGTTQIKLTGEAERLHYVARLEASIAKYKSSVSGLQTVGGKNPIGIFSTIFILINLRLIKIK